MARCARRGDARSTRTATRVPSSGRARSMLGGGEHECIGCEQSSDAVGEMTAGQCRAGDVLDVVIELHWRAVVLADELAPPCRQMHFPAITFVVVENLKLTHAARAIKRHRVVDVFVLADHLVEDEPATGRVMPGIELRVCDLYP